jgi:hypothetical protein
MEWYGTDKLVLLCSASAEEDIKDIWESFAICRRRGERGAILVLL